VIDWLVGWLVLLVGGMFDCLVSLLAKWLVCWVIGWLGD